MSKLRQHFGNYPVEYSQHTYIFNRNNEQMYLSTLFIYLAVFSRSCHEDRSYSFEYWDDGEY
jgi:hypothetical protein